MIVVLCPTRGRPDAAAEMVASLRETAHRVATTAVLVVDEDDPQLAVYRALRFDYPYQAEVVVMVLAKDATGDLVRATNTAAARVWDDDCIIGHVGDDHRFRTPGWDRRIEDALQEPGIAYGDDGYWGPRLCTAWFVSSSLPRALGWLALPTVSHYAIDDAWYQLGQAIDRLHYLPDVRIEHPTPDERPRGPSRHADRAAYREWLATGRARDADTLGAIVRRVAA